MTHCREEMSTSQQHSHNMILIISVSLYSRQHEANNKGLLLLRWRYSETTKIINSTRVLNSFPPFHYNSALALHLNPRSLLQMVRPETQGRLNSCETHSKSENPKMKFLCLFIYSNSLIRSPFLALDSFFFSAHSSQLSAIQNMKREENWRNRKIFYSSQLNYRNEKMLNSICVSSQQF